MDAYKVAALVLTHVACLVLGFVLGHLRARARTTLEKAALDAMRLGDHPPAYVEPPKEEPKS